MRFECTTEPGQTQEPLKAGDIIQLLSKVDGLEVNDVCLVGHWYTNPPTNALYLVYLVRLCDGRVRGNMLLNGSYQLKYRKSGFTCQLKEG